jgi:glycosyltransferase involved in cell wall biosynthesis
MESKLSIIVPAYNEAARIGATLVRMLQFADESKLNVEIIVVDDGSSDDTCEVVRSVAPDDQRLTLLKQPKNMGKGAAVKAGMLQASGDLLLFSDADLSTPIEDVLLLIEHLSDSCPIAIGSRGLKASNLEVRQPFYREMMGRTFNRIVRMVLGVKIRDTQCGFKLFRRTEAKALFGAQKTQGFAFDVEILFRARLAKYDVAEVPVTWRNDERSTVHPIRDAARMFGEVLTIRNMVKKDQKAGLLLAQPDSNGAQ